MRTCARMCQVYDGFYPGRIAEDDPPDVPLLGVFGGAVLPSGIVARSGAMTVVFRTDYRQNYKGFSAHYWLSSAVPTFSPTGDELANLTNVPSVPPTFAPSLLPTATATPTTAAPTQGLTTSPSTMPPLEPPTAPSTARLLPLCSATLGIDDVVEVEDFDEIRTILAQSVATDLAFRLKRRVETLVLNQVARSSSWASASAVFPRDLIESWDRTVFIDGNGNKIELGSRQFSFTDVGGNFRFCAYNMRISHSTTSAFSMAPAFPSDPLPEIRLGWITMTESVCGQYDTGGSALYVSGAVAQVQNCLFAGNKCNRYRSMRCNMPCDMQDTT